MFKSIIHIGLLISYVLTNAASIVSNDNGLSGNYNTQPGWEETILLSPQGPCDITAIQVFLTGSTAKTDTLFVVGDPGEGKYPATFWVQPFALRHDYIVFDYNGSPGWYTFETLGLRSEGAERIGIQHRVKSNGPYIYMDNNGVSNPTSSFIINPHGFNGFNLPGEGITPQGDFMVRLDVNYDFPDGIGGSTIPTDTLLVDITAAAGLLKSTGKHYPQDEATVTDWNNDGWEDVAIGQNLFQNNGDGTFTNVNSDFNLLNADYTCWADYDNDGDQDAYVFAPGTFFANEILYTNTNTIYRNDGGTFTRLDPQEVFLPPYPNPSIDFNLSYYEQDTLHNPYFIGALLWFDYNNDGWLDLYIGNSRKNQQGTIYQFPDQLWKNNGNGTFSNVTAISGVANATSKSPSEYGNIIGKYNNVRDVTPTDFDMDGDIDLHIVNYLLERDQFLLNDGNGTFTDIAFELGLDGNSVTNPNPNKNYNHGQSSDWVDMNQDGFPDGIISCLAHPDYRGYASNPSMIHLNSGAPDYTFTEVQQDVGFKFYETITAVATGDFNSDGTMDLWHGQREDNRPARIYYNTGAPGFTLKEMTWSTGLDVGGATSAAIFDFDHDGDLDFLTKGRLIRNDIDQGNYIKFTIKGNPKKNVPMDAYGTKITLYAGGTIFYRDIMGAKSGFRMAQNSKTVHIGLGHITTIDSIQIKFLNGKTKYLTGLNINQHYSLSYDSLPDQPTSSITIWPNPASEELSVVYEGVANKASTLNIYNLSGKLVYTYYNPTHKYTGNHQITVPITSLKSGCYIMEVKSDANAYSFSKQLVITK